MGSEWMAKVSKEEAAKARKEADDDEKALAFHTSKLFQPIFVPRVRLNRRIV